MEPDIDWRRLLEERGSALVLYARQWTDSLADAEDAVQEGFIRFWKARESGVGDQIAILYVSVKRSALDRRRSETRRNARERFAAETGDKLYFQKTAIEYEERRQAIEKALEELPDSQREVLVMKIWGELTFKQIAEALGESQNTVASRYRYGLQALRHLVDRNT
ncbi:MAG: sigma-70 family RNA polymerase sigma factor [Verrucomicrobia bacterium]|nr:sigma-70 family RNA polymerase sigma factor [Verrucomicrobiota bacterium]